MIGIGDTFQDKSKYQRDHLPGGRLDWTSKPETHKRYPLAPKIPLSAPQTEGGAPIWDAMRQRRSVRRFADSPMQETELSQLLWAAQGITGINRSLGLRTAPSAGALYPIETYLVVHTVEGTDEPNSIEPGIYHYAVDEHQLEQLQTGDFQMEIAKAALDQEIAAWADAVFIWTAVFERSKWKYKQRGYRYVYLDAGHIAQNVALGAVALGLGTCQIAAMYDDEVNTLLDVDGIEESAIYMTVVGKPK
ncbi:MAG: SagB/ThcOx family dehydrogenase [Chloroflexi bacterium]|nr:SagB/ThcOx family dehydrogenase [Chloroflexota bacterium]